MFKQLHKGEKPLIICNVWDASSAQVAEKNGFKAIGTSSAAIAHMFGKADGEQIEFEQLLSLVQLISNASDLPLTVDIESGYGETPQVIANNILQLSEVGVVGINIEDSVVVDGLRRLCDEHEFAEKLKAVKVLLDQKAVEMFINVRSDTYLLNLANPLQASLERIAIYQRAGADGIFLPCINQTTDIEKVVAASQLPINVMCVAGLPDFATLQQLGVKRISMGNFIHQAMLASLSSILSTVVEEKSFDHLFGS